jgi:putative restriction endonuclease
LRRGSGCRGGCSNELRTHKRFPPQFPLPPASKFAVKFWVGITDKNWYEFLRGRSPDEVNFWQPGPRPLAAFLQPGVPFLFKLHAPDHFIVGGGFFVRFSVLPARLAWEAFREKNGVPDYGMLKRRVEQYRKQSIRGDPDIGCNVLNAPFFFSEEDWIPIPADWPANVQRGLTYDTANESASRLWNRVAEHLLATERDTGAAGEPARYGAEYLTRARLGQGTFRILVTEAYQRRCAITGERTLPVLEAAHIRPYAEEGPHMISNGILLREDLHTLFGDGYITLTEGLRVEVSKRIREEFENGREYYAYHGRQVVAIPERVEDRPAKDFLQWHNEHVFVG